MRVSGIDAPGEDDAPALAVRILALPDLSRAGATGRAAVVRDVGDRELGRAPPRAELGMRRRDVAPAKALTQIVGVLIAPAQPRLAERARRELEAGIPTPTWPLADAGRGQRRQPRRAFTPLSVGRAGARRRGRDDARRRARGERDGDPARCMHERQATNRSRCGEGQRAVPPRPSAQQRPGPLAAAVEGTRAKAWQRPRRWLDSASTTTAFEAYSSGAHQRQLCPVSTTDENQGRLAGRGLLCDRAGGRE